MKFHGVGYTVERHSTTRKKSAKLLTNCNRPAGTRLILAANLKLKITYLNHCVQWFVPIIPAQCIKSPLPYKAFLKSCSLMSATSTAVTHKYIFDYWFQAGMKNPRQPADMGKCESCSSAQNNTVVFGLDLGRQVLPLELLALRMYRGICFSVQAAK